MRNDSNHPRGCHPSRRDFLAAGAKVGAGLALAGAGLDLAPRGAEAASATLNYIGINDTLTPSGPLAQIKMFEQQNPGVKVNFLKAPSGAASSYHDKLVTLFSAHDSGIDVADSDVIWQAQWAPAGWAGTARQHHARRAAEAATPQGMICADTIGGHHLRYPLDAETTQDTSSTARTSSMPMGFKPAQDVARAPAGQCADTPEEVSQDCSRFVACYQKGQQLDLQLPRIRVEQRRGGARPQEQRRRPRQHRKTSRR